MLIFDIFEPWLLYYGVQDGFVFSLRKKETFFLLSIGKYLEVV